MRRNIYWVAAIFLLGIGQLNAQTWKEWFRQKKTQKEYLIQQIAALKVYLEYVKKGYKIVDKGLHLVGDIKDGNFHSHKHYFASLQQVNPAVASSGKVSSMLYYEEMVLKMASKMKSQFIASPLLTPEEVHYVKMVIENLVSQSNVNLDRANEVLSDQKLEMKDDERIRRLLALHEDAKDRYTFAREFSNGNHLLIMQREKEHVEIEKRKELEAL